ncbi:MAG TPA: hypothetical protein VNK52_10310 [Hyphomicrobiaceae bacterium]|nr:hypothetical protein [Hyphomicrobiaceae bacterium]
MESLAAITNDPEALATVLSIGFGIALGVFGYVWNGIQEKKRYTFDVLMRYTENTDVLMALHRAWTHVARYKSYDQSRIDADTERSLDILLAYFQSIAVAAKYHMLNDEIVLIARYGSMRSLWDFYRPYVEGKRLQLGRPLLYADLEDFLRRNAARYERYASRQHARRLCSDQLPPGPVQG